LILLAHRFTPPSYKVGSLFILSVAILPATFESLPEQEVQNRIPPPIWTTTVVSIAT